MERSIEEGENLVDALLDLFGALAAGPRTVDELAPRLGLRREAAQRLLDAATSLDLVEKRPGARYGLGVHGASFLGNPAVAKMVEHHALLFRDLADPVALLRGDLRDTELRRFWSYAGGATERANANANEATERSLAKRLHEAEAARATGLNTELIEA